MNSVSILERDTRLKSWQVYALFKTRKKCIQVRSHTFNKLVSIKTFKSHHSFVKQLCLAGATQLILTQNTKYGSIVPIKKIPKPDYRMQPHNIMNKHTSHRDPRLNTSYFKDNLIPNASPLSPQYFQCEQTSFSFYNPINQPLIVIIYTVLPTKMYFIHEEKS